MKWLGVMALISAACFGQEEAKPVCNAARRGQYLPERANSDREELKRAARCGELRMCTAGLFKYKWQPLSIHISRLGRGMEREIPGCITGGLKADD